jgi:hypothetical protein
MMEYTLYVPSPLSEVVARLYIYLQVEDPEEAILVLGLDAEGFV